MDTSEKIKVFGSFEELTQEIVRDQKTHDMLAQRYSIRFIMLNNFHEFRKLAKFMIGIGVEQLDLEALIEEGELDVWITKDQLKNAISSIKKSTFVTPFSEVVRFYNDDDFRGFLNEIMLLEDIHHPAKRVYVPLIGLQNRFVDFLNHFARIQESAPIWRYDAAPQMVEVFLAKYKDFVLPNETVQCQIASLREWLMFWKTHAPQNRIVCTSRPIAAREKYSKPDNIFSFKHIANAYDFMTQFLELNFVFGYDEDDKEYWEELLLHLKNGKQESFDFERFVHHHFNKVKFDAVDIIKEWAEPAHKPFDRWLLKNYVLHTGFAAHFPYMVKCVESTHDLSDASLLPDMIAKRILYADLPANHMQVYAAERRNIILDNRELFEQLIHEESQQWLFERIREIFQHEGGLEQVLDFCTGTFDFEKKLFIGWSKTYPSHKKLVEAVEERYPEFTAYLGSQKPSHFLPDNQWALDYFKAYKQAKIQDEYTDQVAQLVKQKNASAEMFYQWYFAFENAHEVLAEITNSPIYRPDKVVWIDGMGAEFLPYVLYLVEQEQTNMKVVRSQVVRSYLPSSTYHNRFVGEQLKKYEALDNLGHDAHGYKPFDTLIEELKVIKDIISDVLLACHKEPCTVAIVSDHGLSCLSRKVPSKKYEGKFEHEGRYIKTTNGAHADPDYLVHTNEEEGQLYKVALTHASLSKVPTHQVHGGCTPEEVLVPFVLLSNKNVTTSVKSTITLMNPEVMLSNPVINVTVIPEPAGVILTCAGKSYPMKRVGTTWTAVLENVAEGQYAVDIKPEGCESAVVQINVVGMSGMGIDDLMDF